MFNSSSKFPRRKNKRKGNLRQLFRSTDFESLMYPCFTFSRILGLFPYKFNASTMRICRPSYVLSVVIISVLIYLVIYMLYQINVYKNVVFKNNLIRLLDINSFYIVSGFLTVTTYMLNGPRVRFLQTLLDHSLKLPPTTYQSLSKFIHIKDIFGFFYLVSEAILIASLNIVPYWRLLLLTYCELVRFQMDMLFINCVWLLKACFKKINDDLSHLREFIASEPYILTDNYYKQRIPFLILEITELKKHHQNISNVVKMIKIVFSLSIICTLLLSFLSVVFNSYFIMTKIKKSIYMSDKEKEAYQDYSMLSIFIDSVRIVAIVCICESAKNQAMEIKSTVHQVFNRTFNKEIKYELFFNLMLQLRIFSLQLMHRKNVFSIKGLTLNTSLLTSVRN
ncbi:putative gustatory receptor 28a [Cardiocondyla obscurior]|uniref:putative gustatory receptor 28a n=1 Tax=Cardiocondyla obscurior TaxID=286306 RepID=UPI0039656BAD